MFDSGFIKNFTKACALCYKNGAIDMATSMDESYLIRLKEKTKYPNTYGTINNCEQDWNEWRFNLVSNIGKKNEFTEALMDIRGNKSIESIILRVCQRFYNHGAEDYVNFGMPLNAASLKNLSGMFELTGNGYRSISSEKFVQKIQLFTYECLRLDREFIEDFCGNDMEVGRKSHALSKTSYDRFSRMIWLATRKNEWYV